MDFSVVILTYNEDANIEHSIKSVLNHSDDIHIVDSGSNDNTLNIAQQYLPASNIHHHPWENWAVQRQWAQDNISLKYEWLLYLDADELLTDTASKEIQSRSGDADGFLLKFDFYFLGAKIRNGMRPHLRLVRHKNAKWTIRGARDYCAISKIPQTIKSPLKHIDRKGLKRWVDKMNKNSELEALAKLSDKKLIDENVDHEGLLGKIARSSFVQTYFSFFIPFTFFCYRLFKNFSIFTWRQSVIYAFLFGFWYPMLIKAKVIELKNKYD